MVDYQKAFDMVDHQLLLSKLDIYGFNSKAIAWTKSYLSDRMQCVELSKTVKSSPSNIRHGIPQGSNFGPLFFVIFINDLPLYMRNTEVDLFADDTTISIPVDYSKSPQILQDFVGEAISDVTGWASSNKMPVQPRKTNITVVTGKRLKTKCDTRLHLPTSCTVNQVPNA